jgi:hypothetical protein
MTLHAAVSQIIFSNPSIKKGIFGQLDPKVHLWQEWRIEFLYKDIRDYHTRLKDELGATPRTRHFKCA